MTETTPGNVPDQLTGLYNLGRNGIGYVRNKEYDISIEIPSHHRNHAMHKDEVEVAVTGHSMDGLRLGKVLRVLKRAKHGYAGTVEKHRDGYAVVPAQQKDDITILVSELPADASVGDKVYAEVTKWLDNTLEVEGVIKRRLGKPGENDAEMEAFALEKGFSPDFPADVLREAEEIRDKHDLESEIGPKRRDLRDRNVFTIDPEDAKDFDDALSVRDLGDGTYEIGVHIADVAHFVRPHTALDMEARDRATSVYLVDRTIPMLPEVLSNDLCSLNPNTDKCAFTALFVMTADGEVKSEWFGRSSIHSKKRFSYEEAQAVLDNNDGPYLDELQLLNSMAKKLAQARFAAGAISMEQDEVKFLLDDNGKPVDVLIKQRHDTNKLIEEFMLLANRRVAKFMADKTKQSVFVYRIHDKPDMDRVMNLRNFLKQLGYNVSIKDGVIPAHELQQIIDDADSDDERDAISTAVVRSMAKAIYSTENIGHYGLAFHYYTHFTSPIRRYPDLMVHRLLWKVLNNEPIEAKLAEEYKRLADHSSDREREAQYAEWDSLKYKQVEYMADRIGKRFEGVINGMNKGGLFVSEKRSKADGMVRLRDLPGDYWEFNQEKFVMQGRRTGRVYKIGDIVPIIVTDANLERLQIDYKVPEDRPEK